MPRRRRVQYPGAIYHVMSRGDRRSDIFLDDDQMLELMEGQLGGNHAGELHRETVAVKAEGNVAEELRRSGWSEQYLANRSKSDPGKLAIASRLRRETTIKRITERTQLGTAKSANERLHGWMRLQTLKLDHEKL